MQPSTDTREVGTECPPHSCGREGVGAGGLGEGFTASWGSRVSPGRWLELRPEGAEDRPDRQGHSPVCKSWGHEPVPVHPWLRRGGSVAPFLGSPTSEPGAWDHEQPSEMGLCGCEDVTHLSWLPVLICKRRIKRLSL